MVPQALPALLAQLAQEYLVQRVPREQELQAQQVLTVQQAPLVQALTVPLVQRAQPV